MIYEIVIFIIVCFTWVLVFYLGRVYEQSKVAMAIANAIEKECHTESNLRLLDSIEAELNKIGWKLCEVDNITGERRK
jgi:uncharacterized membrane protein (DUF106 family)